jgi:hypothetical protein
MTAFDMCAILEDRIHRKMRDVCATHLTLFLLIYKYCCSRQKQCQLCWNEVGAAEEWRAQPNGSWRQPSSGTDSCS